MTLVLVSAVMWIVVVVVANIAIEVVLEGNKIDGAAKPQREV